MGEMRNVSFIDHEAGIITADSSEAWAIFMVIFALMIIGAFIIDRLKKKERA